MAYPDTWINTPWICGLLFHNGGIHPSRDSRPSYYVPSIRSRNIFLSCWRGKTCESSSHLNYYLDARHRPPSRLGYVTMSLGTYWKMLGLSSRPPFGVYVGLVLRRPS